MSEEKSYEPVHALAKHWARKGPGEVEKVQATLNLARQMLAGEVQLYDEGENPFELELFAWERSEVSADVPRRIFLGTVTDLVTGQGHTVWFAAGLARNEDDFRRQLASYIGHNLANGAEVGTDLRDFRFSRTFLSAPLLQTLEKFDQGIDAPAELFFTSRWHENRS